MSIDPERNKTMKIKELEKYRPFFNAMIRHSIVPQSEFGKHTDDGQLQVTVHAMDATTVTVNANRTFQMVLSYTGDTQGIEVGATVMLNTRTGEITPVKTTKAA